MPTDAREVYKIREIICTFEPERLQFRVIAWRKCLTFQYSIKLLEMSP